MNYAANYIGVRSRIEDGDLIAVRKHGKLFAGSTWNSAPAYTHTAIAMWLDDGLWAAEMRMRGAALVPLSQYAADGFDVFACPVDAAEVRFWTLENLRDRIPCTLTDLARVAWAHLLRGQWPPGAGAIKCARYCSRVYRYAGWKERLPLVLAPMDLVDALDAGPKLYVDGELG